MVADWCHMSPLPTVKSNCWVRLKNELYAVSGDWINSYLPKGLDQGLVADKVLSCTTLPKYDICIFQDSEKFNSGCRQVIRSYRISKAALAEHADAELPRYIKRISEISQTQTTSESRGYIREFKGK